MNLVYFVIGSEPKYSQLLEYCINTIRCYPENDNYDIMVMCDAEYSQNIKHLPVRIHITESNVTAMQASMRKVEIFKADIEKYDKILYLDSDIVISGSLGSIFDCVEDPSKLYVKKEGSHTDIYWSRADAPYDTATLNRFKDHGISSFNCGQFAFKKSPEMHQHFENVLQEIKAVFNPAVHFYEQVFMNNYFCTGEHLLYNLDTKCHIFNSAEQTHDFTGSIINHFANASCHWSKKLVHMANFHMKLIMGRDVPVIDTRELLHTILKVPESPTIAEIGIFRGEFADVLYRTFNPSRFILVDPWLPEMICSGDQNGNDVVYYHGDELYKHVTDKFSNENKIEIQRKFSSDAVIDSQSLDILYIDGDHSYKGVAGDLERGRKWVKPNGWICGHDFAMNPAKTNNRYDFGVARAVSEFCHRYGYKIWWLALDGCVSFVIRA